MDASANENGHLPVPTQNINLSADSIADIPDWLIPVSSTIAWTELTDKTGTTMTTHTSTWNDFVTHLQTVGTFPSKDKCPWLKMATFGNKRTPQGSLRHNDNVVSIYGIEGDYDGEAISMDQAVSTLEHHHIRAALYPSPSSTAEKPRWRVICPLSHQHSPTARRTFVERLNAVLGGVLAPESFTLSQSYYFGGTPTNEYRVATTNGRCIDLLECESTPSIEQTPPVSVAMTDIEIVKSALAFIDPDCGRENWRNVGFALKHALGETGYSIWDRWSKGDGPQPVEKYPGERETKQQWDSFRNDGATPITIATLYKLAAERGWRPPNPDVGGMFPNLCMAGALLTPVSVFDVVSHPSEPPAFIWDGYLPSGNVSLFGAHGGTGKSTIGLMLAVCIALGRLLFGIATTPCKALFVSLEDGAHVVRHRLAHICRAWAIDPEQLRDSLLIVDGTENPELFTAETRGGGGTTLSYLELRKLVQSEKFGLVVIDNASDAFGGDEIQRRQVRAFMRSLAEIARLTDCAVLLLAHVDKTTSRNRKAEGGEAYSGSTAWHNSARSRLFLSRAENGTLTLEHQKSNLGRMREPITLTWPEGGLPTLDSVIPSAERIHADSGQALDLLRLIAEFEGRGQYCSTATTARNNVYAMLRGEPDFQKLKLTSDASKRIIHQCQRDGWLESLEYRKPDRKVSERWSVTALGRSVAASAASLRLVEQTAQTAGRAASAACPLGGTGESAHHKDAADKSATLVPPRIGKAA
jgi:RecA-family ATPase